MDDMRILENGSSILYGNFSSDRFDVAEGLELRIKEWMVQEPDSLELHLYFALIELGVFEELRGAKAPLEALLGTLYNNEALLLLVFGYHTYTGVVPHELRMALVGLAFDTPTLRSCRAYLEAMSIADRLDSTANPEDAFIEGLLIDSLAHHPSNFMAISALQDKYLSGGMYTTKADMRALLERAIAWRLDQLRTVKASKGRLWLLETEEFLRSMVIQSYDSETSKLWYVERLKKKLIEVEQGRRIES